MLYTSTKLNRWSHYGITSSYKNLPFYVSSFSGTIHNWKERGSNPLSGSLSPPKVNFSLWYSGMANFTLLFLCFVPAKFMIAIDTLHVFTSISLGNQNAALGALGPAVIDAKIVALHVFKRTNGGIKGKH
mmetsp:Transcript_29869/g.49016  ORF Transcript_29869/g.49016 Transcript_29869/m.49016 type:complete len:130 (+) Transcript_29869:161-550(+)